MIPLGFDHSGITSGMQDPFSRAGDLPDVVEEASLIWACVHFFFKRGVNLFGKRATKSYPTRECISSIMAVDSGGRVNAKIQGYLCRHFWGTVQREQTQKRQDPAKI